MKEYIQRTNLVQAGLVGLLAGLLLAKLGYFVTLTMVVSSFLLLPLMLRMKWVALITALMVGLSVGLWRGAQTYAQLHLYDKFKDQKVTIVGSVRDDAVYADRGQLEFQISQVFITEPATDLPGTVRVRGFNAPSVRRGDIVEITGKLREGFGARQGFVSFAQIEVIARDNSTLEQIRSRYFAGVYSALPEPHASLGLGFLVGTRMLMPDDLTAQLSATGLTHIVAVSGYNLTILVRLTRRLFSKRSIYLSTITSLALILGFVLVTGLSPSISRAMVVSTLAITAWYFGREIKPTILILTSAAITAMVNPLYLWFDLGWYLSFAAFFGVLVLAPLITKRFFKKRPKIFGQIIIETTSAQLMALPIIAVVFSELSLISLLANVIVLPLIPLAMLLTFIAGVVGMVVPHISSWLAWPADIILTFIVDMVRVLANIPWALKQVDMSWYQLAMIYSSVLFVIIILSKKLRTRLNGAEVIE